MAAHGSIFAGAGTVPVRAAVARAAGNAAPADPPIPRFVERSPVLLRKVNELMRDGRRGQTEPEQVPFFCECERADCYEPVWLTGDMYDERRGELRDALVLPGHEHAHAGTHPEQAAG